MSHPPPTPPVRDNPFVIPDGWLGRFLAHQGASFDVAGAGQALLDQLRTYHNHDRALERQLGQLTTELTRHDTILNFRAMGKSTSEAVSVGKRRGYVNPRMTFRILAATATLYHYALPALRYDPASGGGMVPPYVRDAVRDVLSLPWVQPYHSRTGILKLGLYDQVNQWLTAAGGMALGVDMLRDFQSYTSEIVDYLHRLLIAAPDLVSASPAGGGGGGAPPYHLVVRSGGRLLGLAAFVDGTTYQTSPVRTDPLEIAVVPNLADRSKGAGSVGGRSCYWADPVERLGIVADYLIRDRAQLPYPTEADLRSGGPAVSETPSAEFRAEQLAEVRRLLTTLPRGTTTDEIAPLGIHFRTGDCYRAIRHGIEVLELVDRLRSTYLPNYSFTKAP